jgi:hypothetical protein
MGLPHSKTWRKHWRVIRRDSVLECGSPMLLLLLADAPTPKAPFLDPMLLHVGVQNLLASATTSQQIFTTLSTAAAYRVPLRK